MTKPDWAILILFLAGTLLVGMFLGRLVKSASDMFAAGGRSPWWLSGLSAFMTMFSANTFVVWGGVAYQHGVVAVIINLCYGIAAIAAGYTVAGRWNRLGIRTPAEYVERRFGRGALHFYTWFMMAFRIIGSGGALYAIATLTLAVIGGGDSAGAFVLDPAMLCWAIAIFAAIVVAYTMVGGLWAVLVTDTLQFLILNLAVLFVIPLSLAAVGGLGGFIAEAPPGFFNPTSARFTWWFLAGWVAIHYFMIGAEWAFVQRYLCVPSPRAARKSTYLFGGLYLFSPFLWLLPPMLWRVRSPIPEGADATTVTRLAETAYIVSCKAVLPAGMLGLMLAAMFSATASMISSQLNVFSGVLTENIYRPLVRDPDEKRLLHMGRVFTCLLGMVIAGIAMATPYLGGAAKLIIGVTEMMVTPLLAPTMLALFCRRLGAGAIWWTVGICFPLGVLGKFHPALADTLLANSTLTGVLLPLLIVGCFLLFARREAPGWASIANLKPPGDEDQADENASLLPARIVAYSLMFCALVLLALIPPNPDDRGQLAVFGIILLALGFLVLAMARKPRSNQPPPAPLS
jgi:Na+/proline symporter